MHEWPEVDPHFLFKLLHQGLAPAQHPGEIPCTLLSTNLPEKQHQTSSGCLFQVTELKDTNIWHALNLEYSDQRFFYY